MSAPVPFYQDEAVCIYHGDCRDIAPTLNAQAVVADPPYGMAWDTNSKRFSGGNTKRWEGRSDYRAIAGDSEPFDPVPWLAYPWVVLWGANHYAARLPTGTTLVWIKRADGNFGTFLSDGEIAWRKGGHGVYCYRKQFPPPSRMAELGRATCVHPTQKPVGLMQWCIERSGAPSDAVVLDPFMGTGTTLVAAKRMGRRAIGVERELRYCEIAVKRLRQSALPLEITA